jgi:hypothetical protein
MGIFSIVCPLGKLASSFFQRFDQHDESRASTLNISTFFFPLCPVASLAQGAES